MSLSKQEVFDICATIILVAAILSLGVWLAVDYTEKPRIQCDTVCKEQK